MFEPAFARSVRRAMILLAAGAVLRCGDEADSAEADRAEPSTVVAPTRPSPRAPAQEPRSPSPAPRGVGSPALKVPPITSPLTAPTRALPPVEPPTLALPPRDADAGVSPSWRPTSGR